MAKKNLHTKRGIASGGDPNKLYGGANSFKRRPSIQDQMIGMEAYYKNADYSYDQASTYSTEFFAQSQSFTTSSNANNFSDLNSNADLFDPFAPPHPVIDTDIIPSNNSSANNDSFFPSEPLSASTTDDFESKLPPLFGSNQPSRGFSSVLYNSDTLLSKSLGSMNLTDYAAPSAEPYTSTRSNSFSYSPPVHPGADQNPPCNTLYVGNLPNDSCEEELRHLFQCCAGYKRLSFKTRANGPMCFVEVNQSY